MFYIREENGDGIRANNKISLHRLTTSKAYYAMYYICSSVFWQVENMYWRCILYYAEMRLISLIPIG